MADTTEIAIDFSSWDKLIGSVEGATKASKEFGETYKKALMGEVLVNSINRIASGMKDGIAKESTAAAGTVAQGFFMGGPAGATLAAFSVAVLKVGDAFEAIENKAAAAAARLSLAGAQANEIRRRDEGFADIRRERSDIEIARIEAGKVRKERDEQDRIAAAAARRQAFVEKRAADADAKEYIESQLLSVAYLEQGIREEAFQEELDTEAAQAERRRDAEREGRAARYESWQQDIRDFDAAQAVERDQQLTLARQAADARLRVEQDAAKQLYDSRMAAQNAVLAMGAQAGNAFAQQIGGAVGALAQLDAAQIAAAASSQDLGASLASAALESVQGVLASVAQEATAKAALATAKGIGALAGVGTAPLAPGFFGEAAAFAGVAALAGGGAIAAGTAATAVRPAAATLPTGGGTSGGSGGGVTINVSTGRIFSTEADIGASVEHSRKQFERYRGYR